VHLADFPVADENKIDGQLTADIRLAMKVSSLGRAARSQAGIKVRQPLAVNYIGVSSEWEKRALESEAIKQMVLDELNVKEIRLATTVELAAIATEPDYVVDNEATASTALYTKLSPELEAEGMAREIVHRLQIMRRSAGFDIADHIITYYQGEDYIRGVMVNADTAGYIKQETLSTELVEGIPEKTDLTESYKLGDYDILLGVKRLA
jgi:isoleucyl-tRNA synthetase